MSGTQRVLWVLMTAMCLLFAPMAAEFYWITISEQTPTYAKVMAAAVSHDYAMGPTSGHAEMTPYWQSMPRFNQTVLGVHAVLATLALILGPFQFLPTLRRRRPRLHRGLGYAYFGAGVPAMLLAFVYLSITPMDKIYGGAPFAVGLWGIAVLTTFTFCTGLFHIVRGEVQAHKTIMVLNFGALLIAPLLRVWWIVLGWIFFTAEFNSQATSHTAVLMFLGLETLVGAIVFMHVFEPTQRPSQSSEAIETFRRRTLSSLPVWTACAKPFGALCAAVLCLQGVVRLHGGPDVLTEYRDPESLVRELNVFATHAPFFWSQTLGLALFYGATPGVITDLFGTARPRPARRYLMVGGVLATCIGWLGLAHGFGMDGPGGWGASVYWVVLASTSLLFLMLHLNSLRQCSDRQAREFVLHLCALMLVPVTVGVGQTLFLWAGFGWEDAFLSAAVIATSLNLSFSYYYTVYGARGVPQRAQRQRAA